MIPNDVTSCFKGQRVLVTGASGFIGWHVADLLMDAGADVRALVRPTSPHGQERVAWVEGDLRERDTVAAALNGCRYAFHVAGDYRFWARDQREIFANNVQGTINFLDAAEAAGVQNVVYTSTTGILERGTPERLATEDRLASPDTFKGPYKRSKFAGFFEAQRRANAGRPIVIALPTAPIGPHDLKPTPTGMIIVQFLNGRIPMLARTGLNFVDVRQCALGHLLALVRGRRGERYLLGGTNLWLGEFLQKLEPYGSHRAPTRHAPHWLSYATACVSETIARMRRSGAPFVTRESVQMSRGPHFSSNAKAERELGYEDIPIDDAIRDAVADFAARGLVPQMPKMTDAPGVSSLSVFAGSG
ncbi:MAG TPA: NAD-dependent epimerase/dehydratase family protein, partial [Chthoniobacterales bacterium]|nr:NAD-dependent epimerase/dehydratase family protein [Chthoniobacterales bacterium]